MAKVTGIIQARMSSKRLPGKVLRDLCGKPILWHVVQRLRRSQTISELVIATSEDPSDDAIEAYARELGVPCVRGPLDDVLARFRRALERFPADVVVRVTGDCPLVDPGFVDHCVATLLAEDGDYIDAVEPELCIHEGCDPASMRIFERLWHEAPDDPVAREHTTGYFKVNPGFGRRVLVTIPDTARVSRPVRISVDTPSDLAFLTAVYMEAGAAPGMIDIEDVVRLIESRPSLRDINAHVRQRDPDKRARSALLVCQASQRVGMGHLSRVLAVGNALREHCSWGVSAVVEGDEPAFEWASAHHVRALIPPEPLDGPWVDDLIRAEGPDAVVIDVRDGLAKDTVERWRKLGPLVVLIDDGSPRRDAADTVFYPPLSAPQMRAVASTTPVFSGWEWVVTGAEPVPDAAPPERLLVVMGGSDPRGWTGPLCAALSGRIAATSVDVVLGPGVADADAVAADIGDHLPGAIVHRAPPSLAPLLAGAGVAIAAFGVSAYEAVAARTPVCLICADADQAASASALVAAGAALSHKAAHPLNAETVVQTAIDLINDPGRRAAMAKAAAGLIDGRGAERIATWIAETVEARD